MAFLISDRNSKSDMAQDQQCHYNCADIWELVYLPIKTDYTRIEKTAYSFYVRRLADGGQEKGSRERTAMLPEGYHKRYTKQISGYEPLRAVRTPINSMKAQRFKALLKPIVTI